MIGENQGLMVESDTKSGLLESLHDVHSFDSEWNNSPKSDTRIDMGNPDLKTGMVFANREVLKEAIRQYGSLNRYKSEVWQEWQEEGKGSV